MAFSLKKIKIRQSERIKKRNSKMRVILETSLMIQNDSGQSTHATLRKVYDSMILPFPGIEVALTEQGEMIIEIFQ